MDIKQQEWHLSLGGEDHIYLKEKWLDTAEGGPAILLVHGFNPLGHLGNYDIPVPGFSGMDFLAARGYDVFALDMRGFGQSSRPETLTLEDNIADVHTVVAFILKERNAERLSLLGGSYGGPIVFTYASRHPNLLERLIMLGTAYQHFPLEMMGMLEALRKAAEARRMAYVPLPISREADNTFVETEQAFLDWRADAAQHYNLSVPVHPLRDFPFPPDEASKVIHAITTPTLLLLGDKDIAAHIDDNIAMLADLGSVEKSLIIIGNAGHSLMYETKRNYIWSLVCSGLPQVAATAVKH